MFNLLSLLRIVYKKQSVSLVTHQPVRAGDANWHHRFVLLQTRRAISNLDIA